MRNVLFVVAVMAMGMVGHAHGAEGALPAVRVIVDTDIDSDCDDVGALAMLHAMADAGEATILAVMMSDANGESPACTAAINTYYGRGEIPVGVRRPGGGKANSKYAAAIAKEFPHAFSYEKAPDAVALYRKVLAGQPDGAVVIISIGTLENLAELLESNGDAVSPLDGVALVKAKVRLWSCMGGHYPGGGKDAEHNFKFGKSKTAQAINGWPGPILFSGWEVGNRLITGKALGAPSEKSPVRRAYELYCKPGQGRQSWDQTSVLAAIRGPQKWWDVKRGGYNHIEADGRNQWRTDQQKDHGYLVEKVKPAEVVELMDGLMAAPPKGR